MRKEKDCKQTSQVCGGSCRQQHLLCGLEYSAYNMYESSRPVKKAEVNYQSVDTFNQEIATAATTAE